MSDVRIPRATYRLQFTPEFGFNEALNIVPYLRSLGISHIYASPVTRARKGSTHGYDVCDPSMVNPDIGSLEEFEELLSAVAAAQMGWVQDIVPNHMAYSKENPYLIDVLENGQSSPYATFFDITWDHQYEGLRGRLLAPFLGKPYGQCVVDGELRVVFEDGRLWVAYYDHRYPLSPESYATVLVDTLDDEQPLHDTEQVQSLRERALSLRGMSDASHAEDRGGIREALQKLYLEQREVAGYIEGRLKAFATGTAAANARFDALMLRQHFRLAFWKICSEELNYRRFFTISDLICIRAEREEVFNQTHAFIMQYVDKGLIDGLRIDHIDGLFDPAAYLKRLRARAPQTYIVVEKILDKTEHLPPDWPVQGSTGYDFLNHLNYVLCDTGSERRFDRLYQRVAGARDDPLELQSQKKRLIIGKHMAGDIDNLAHLIVGISGTDLMGRDITLYGLRRALVEVLTHFPVYRTYIASNYSTEADARYISGCLSLARSAMPGFTTEFAFIERFLMLKGDTILQRDFDDTWREAVMRFQQFTGPLMAKGFEDTLFYVYNRHVALNEVGGWPMHFGIPLEHFHSFVKTRLRSHPHSMNASATHDTKRGEDNRARLQVLSEIPAEWSEQVSAWKKLNMDHTECSNGRIRPDGNDEYMFYQTLVGTLPAHGDIDDTYVARVKEYMIKAVREAKVHTAWINPDERYEQTVATFVESCLDSSKSPLFIDALRTFARRVSWFGMLNSLSQLVLKTMLPGVPDFYQGTEQWDFSLVDPDNRRPVDYAARTRLPDGPSNLAEALPDDSDGHIKQHLTKRCLVIRRQRPRLFEQGNYTPLQPAGRHGKCLLAFTREYQGQALLVLVPRFTSRLVKRKQYPFGRHIWNDTRLALPPVLRDVTAENALTGREVTLKDELMVGDILDSFPLAVLVTPVR